MDAYRDWGHAADYVKAMWMMLQHDEPDDYVVATGKTYSIREFLDEAFSYVGDIKHWRDVVVIDPKFYRPAEVEYLRGSPAKAKEVLGWEPEIGFKDLVMGMLRNDLNVS